MDSSMLVGRHEVRGRHEVVSDEIPLDAGLWASTVEVTDWEMLARRAPVRGAIDSLKLRMLFSEDS